MVQRRQRMRPAILPALAGREELIAPTCTEPGCILQPNTFGGTHPGLHMAVEYEDQVGAPFGHTSHPTTRRSKALYSWWGRLGGRFTLMDGDSLNRAMDRFMGLS